MRRDNRVEVRVDARGGVWPSTSTIRRCDQRERGREVASTEPYRWTQPPDSVNDLSLRGNADVNVNVDVVGVFALRRFADGNGSSR